MSIDRNFFIVSSDRSVDISETSRFDRTIKAIFLWACLNLSFCCCTQLFLLEGYGIAYPTEWRGSLLLDSNANHTLRKLFDVQLVRVKMVHRQVRWRLFNVYCVLNAWTSSLVVVVVFQRGWIIDHLKLSKQSQVASLASEFQTSFIILITSKKKYLWTFCPNHNFF